MGHVKHPVTQPTGDSDVDNGAEELLAEAAFIMNHADEFVLADAEVLV